MWENEESFRLVLTNPGSHGKWGATLGGQTTVRILVDDPEDRKLCEVSLYDSGFILSLWNFEHSGQTKNSC